MAKRSYNNISLMWWAKALFLSLFVPLFVYAFSSGPPLGVTGGFGEFTCNQGGCHVGIPVNAGPGSVAITGAPAIYQSGVTYPIIVRVADPDQIRRGFELAARNEQGQQAGTLTSTDPFSFVRTFNNGVQYITHNTAGSRLGEPLGVDFAFNWTAPDISTGPVLMHVAGNAANGNSTTSGDRIYTSFITIQPAPPGPLPSISDGSTVNNASFALHPAPMASGSIAAIFGEDLNDGSALPSSFFGNDGLLSTSLGSASVTVNGIPAPIFYSFPTQLGIQIPSELAGETSAILQITALGQLSVQRTIFLDSAAPGIFSLNQQGNGPGAIIDVDGEVISEGNPATVGETIILFATGLGAVDPPVGTGAPAGASLATAQVTLLVDGVVVIPDYAGTAPNFVGLDQVNFTVPAGTQLGNDIPVVLRVDGRESNPVTIVVGP